MLRRYTCRPYHILRVLAICELTDSVQLFAIFQD
jgi:hypothetical protein